MSAQPREYKPGVWHVYFDVPRGADGKRRQKCVTFRGTKREAQRAQARLQTEARAGNIASTSRETVGSYVTRWLETRAGKDLAPKTLETWNDFARAYIIPQLGRVPLEKLTASQVEEFYAFLRTSGRTRGEGGLSGRSVLHVHRLLSEILKSAVHRQIIPRNPCEPVAPSCGHAARRSVLDADGVRRLLDAAEGTWMYAAILIAAGMGLRRGEVLGLRWQDVDFKAGTLAIEQTVQNLRGRGVVFKEPKTQNSRRIVTMPEFVAVELRRVKGRQAEHSLLMGPGWTEPGLVFRSDEDGSPQSPAMLPRRFARLLRTAGLPPMSFHDLRHTNATLLLLAGVDTKIVSARLGHCNTTITRDLYQHVTQEMDQDAADKTDGIFRGALG